MTTMDFDQQGADRRHRERRERLQRLRNELTEMIDYYWDSFPQSSERERDLEYRIRERLRSIERGIDTFIRDFENKPNG